jgi:hypothetical protein
VDLQRRRTVLQRIADLLHLPGQFARLAQRDEAGVEFARNERAEDEAARLDRGDQRDRLAAKRCTELFGRGTQRRRIGHQRRQVTELDARGRKVGNSAHMPYEVVHAFTPSLQIAKETPAQPVKGAACRGIALVIGWDGKQASCNRSVIASLRWRRVTIPWWKFDAQAYPSGAPAARHACGALRRRVAGSPVLAPEPSPAPQ